MSHPNDFEVNEEALAEYTDTAPALQRSPTPYDSLPEPIKAIYSEREYMWLTTAEKQRIIEMECEPDVVE
jgi:hypothetical protein